MTKMMKPMIRERRLVKTPNAISSLTSPNDVKPPIIRYPVEFISVQNASQKSVRAKYQGVFFFTIKKTWVRNDTHKHTSMPPA